MVVIGAVVGAVVASLAVFVDWLPAQASDEGGRIDFIFWLTTWICVGIFTVVASLIVYSVVKFRASPDDESDGLPIHGHTGLEIVWTAVPFVLVTIISIASGVVLAKNGDAGSNPLRVRVLAQQFAWRFTYPNGKSSGILALPLHRKVELRLHARDVIHSFWSPELRQKQDAVPGIETRLVITPKKLGTYPVICTELCGLGHSLMRTQAIVMRPAAFQRWLAKKGAGQ
jgi:cytochrome c oxidase subunit 2